MKKVAIVSCYFQHNYGSMLQAYATQEILDELNIQNETINISGFEKEIHNRKIKYFKNRIFSADVIKDKSGFIKLKIAQKINNNLSKDINLRDKAFISFSDSFFRLSEKFNSINELGNKSDNYSAFLVGSDQLWLPSNIAADYYNPE